MIDNQIREINQWIGAMNNRITVIESIINDENYQEMINTIKIIRRAIDGDSDLNVPPLYDTMTEFSKAIGNLKAYQEKDQEYHHDMKIIIIGMAIMHFITLIIAIIALLQ